SPSRSRHRSSAETSRSAVPPARAGNSRGKRPWAARALTSGRLTRPGSPADTAPARTSTATRRASSTSASWPSVRAKGFGPVRGRILPPYAGRPMVEVIVARHGESEYSAVGRVNGDPAVPCPLTDQGRDEARAFGRTLDGVPIDLCVTSEFRRTKETADLALEGRDVVRLVLPDLNDLAAGDFEGEPLGDLRAWLRRHGPLAELPGGGEP